MTSSDYVASAKRQCHAFTLFILKLRWTQMFLISSLFLDAKNHAMSVAHLIQLGKWRNLPDDLIYFPSSYSWGIFVFYFFFVHSYVRLYYTLCMGCYIRTPVFWAKEARTETVFKEKHDVWYPVTELIITSPYVHSRVDLAHVLWGATLCQSRP
jgi:hypothetical protein